MKEHIAKGYPFPQSVASWAFPGATITERLTDLAKEYVRNRNSANASGSSRHKERYGIRRMTAALWTDGYNRKPGYNHVAGS